MPLSCIVALDRGTTIAREAGVSRFKAVFEYSTIHLGYLAVSKVMVRNFRIYCRGNSNFKMVGLPILSYQDDK
jgi:hypothetical protein